jgi:hypothetical protein
MSASRAERDRIRHLIALDATGVHRRLMDRREEMIEIFGRQRDRDALLLPLRSVFTTMRFGDMAILSIEDQRAVHGYYESLDDMHWYLKYTVDMPGTLEQRLQHFLRELTTSFDRMIARIGSVTEEQLYADMPSPTPALPPRRPKVLVAKKRPAKKRAKR